MNFVPSDAARGQDSADFLDRMAERMRVESGGDLPRAYYLDQLRRIANSVRPAKKDEIMQSSACFDTWAHPN